MRKLILIALLASAAFAQTAINDTLYLQGATPWTGQITVSWPAFTSCTGTPIARGSRVSPVNAGVVAISLWPSDCAAPSFAYSATYRTMGGANHGQTWAETWAIPSSPSIVTLRGVRQSSTLKFFPSQLIAAGLADGSYCIDVASEAATGLVACSGGGGGGPVTWSSVTGKPSTFTPSAHASTHASAGSDPLTLSKSQVGLGSVLNVAQEPALGNPDADGKVLSSTATGVRSWITPTGGGVSTGALNTWTRTQTFAPTTDETGIKAVCASGQTAPIVSVFKSDGSTVIMQANCDGTVNLGSGTGPQTWMAVTSPGGNPSVGQLYVYADNTNLGLWSKDSNGIAYRMVKPLTAVGGTCVTGLGADGVLTTAACGGGGMVYPSAGIAKSTGSAWTAPAYTDISALWASGSCSGYLKSDGTCSTPGGGATIPSTTNMLKGDGAGNGADAGFAATDVARLSQNQTVAGNRTYQGTQDASGAAHTTPAKTGAAASKPATCTVGETYFANDATAGQNLYFCTATNTWTQQSAGGGSVSAGANIAVSGSTVSFEPFDQSVFWLVENFCGGDGSIGGGYFGALGWRYQVVGSGTPTMNTAGALDANHFCGMKATSPASINNGVSLALVNNGNRGWPSAMWASATFRPTEIQAIAKIGSTSNIRFYLAFSNGPTVIPTAFSQGCWIRYDTTLSDTAWTAVCGDGSAVTTATITGTVDTNVHRFRIRTTSANTYLFSVDGGTEASVSKTVAAGALFAPGFLVSNDGTSTTSFMEAFSFKMRVTGLSVN